MKKKIQVFVTPTESKTLVSRGTVIPSLFYCPKYKRYDEEGEVYQHIHVTSNEKLLDGDYFLWYSQNNNQYEIHKYHSDAGYGIKTYTEFNEKDESSLIVNNSGNCGKIIKTTDNLEIKTVVYYGMSGFTYTDKISTPSKKFIKDFIERHNKN